MQLTEAHLRELYDSLAPIEHDVVQALTPHQARGPLLVVALVDLAGAFAARLVREDPAQRAGLLAIAGALQHRIEQEAAGHTRH